MFQRWTNSLECIYCQLYFCKQYGCEHITNILDKHYSEELMNSQTNICFLHEAQIIEKGVLRNQKMIWSCLAMMIMSNSVIWWLLYLYKSPVQCKFCNVQNA